MTSAHPVALIPGEGIGPETTAAARRCIEATGTVIDWEICAAGEEAYRTGGEALPLRTVEAIRERGIALKGPLATRSGAGYRSANLELRHQLDVYAGIRPCRTLPGAPVWGGPVDVTIVRMNNEDLYAGIEFDFDSEGANQIREVVAAQTGSHLAGDAGLSLKTLSASETARVARIAFNYARDEGRTKVTAVHKASVMRSTDGLLVSAAERVSRDYPEVDYEARLVDTACHDLIARPGSCDVLLCPIQYGDILSDVGAALIGGLGLLPGVNVGDHCAVFESAHGTAPRHAGANRVNPIAMVLCGAMLLERLGEAEAASRLGAAVRSVVAAGEVLSYDLYRGKGRPAGTSDVADAIVAALR